MAVNAAPLVSSIVRLTSIGRYVVSRRAAQAASSRRVFFALPLPSSAIRPQSTSSAISGAWRSISPRSTPVRYRWAAR